jgi:dTDP-4-amino-4,6-dideoxygalactose transaminase
LLALVKEETFVTRKAWRKSYLHFGSPYIGPEERAEVLACIDSGWLGTGPRVQRLEREFQQYVGARAVVAVSSATAALHLALKALRLEPGTEVITSAMTFCATANAIIHAGLTPVFADCDLATFNLDIADVERKLTPRTGAILPVHFAGRPCEMEALMALAQSHSVHIVEDCAHAIESMLHGRHCGTFGEFGCFSFYVTKNLTTVEGGMVVCRNPASADRLKRLTLHGMSTDAWSRLAKNQYTHYEVLEPGFKYNLTDLAASFGIHQLARLETMYARRQELWTYYQAELKPLPLLLPAPVPAEMRHSYHLLTCLVDDRRTRLSRDQILEALHELRIGAGVHYRALPLHRYYRDTYGYHEGDFPHAEFIGERTFSLPFSVALTDEDAADVVRALKEILA